MQDLRFTQRSQQRLSSSSMQCHAMSYIHISVSEEITASVMSVDKLHSEDTMWIHGQSG